MRCSASSATRSGSSGAEYPISMMSPAAWITPPVDPPKGVEDGAVRGLVEVLRLDHLDDVGNSLGREHHGTKDGFLGFQVVGRDPFGAETANIVSSRCQRSPSPGYRMARSRP